MERNIFSSNRSTLRPTKWLLLVGFIIIVFFVAWLYLPYALSNHIKKLLIDYGHENVEINDFNFHPFTGRIIASDIKFSTKNQYQAKLQFLSVKISWLPLMDKQILIENILVKDAVISVADLDKLPYRKVTDIEIIKTIEQLFPKQILNSFDIELLEVYKTKVETTVSGVKTDYIIDRMALDDLNCCNSQNTTKIEFKGQIDETPFSFIGEASIFGDIPSVSGDFSASGLSLGNYNDVFGHWFTTIDGQLFIDSKLNLSVTADKIRINQTGTFKLQKLFAENKEIRLVNEQLKWEGESDITLNRNYKMDTLSANGRVMSNDFYVTLSYYDLIFEYNNLRWKGIIESNLHEDNNQYNTKLNGEINLYQVLLNNTKKKAPLLTSPNITVSGFRSDNLNTIEAKSIAINDAKLIHSANDSTNNNFLEKSFMWQSANINIKNWKLEALYNLTISEIIANNNRFNLHRLEDKTWLFFDSPYLVSNERQSPDTVESSLLIKQLTLLSPNRLHFIDDTIKPRYEASMTITDTVINEISSRETDNNIDINFSAILDNQAKINLTGNASIFAPINDFQLDGIVRDFPLNSISPYTDKHSNYLINNGSMDGKFSVQSIGNNLKTNTRFFYSNLQVENTNAKNISNFQKNLKISLNSAIGYLNNNKKQFKAILSIDSDLTDPNLNLYDAYFSALGKHIRDKSLLRIKKQFRPYNKSISTVRYNKTFPEKIILHPTKFSPGNTLLNTKAIEYLDKIISVLTKRSDFNVRLCGRASRHDRKIFNMVLKGTGPSRGINKGHIKLAKLYLKSVSSRKGQNINSLLYKLSNDRVKVVKNYLLSQRAIAKNQIKNCKPSIDNRKSSSPRVDLLL